MKTHEPALLESNPLGNLFRGEQCGLSAEVYKIPMARM